MRVSILSAFQADDKLALAWSGGFQPALRTAGILPAQGNLENSGGAPLAAR